MPLQCKSCLWYPMSENFELVSRGSFGNLLLRLQDEQYSERSVEKVNIEDNKHCHKVMLVFL